MIRRKIINPQGIGYEGEKIHHSATRFSNGYEIRLTVDEEISKRHKKSLPLIKALNTYINKETYIRQKIIDDKVKEYKKKGWMSENYRLVGMIIITILESDEYNANVKELNKIYDEVQILDRTKLDFKPKNKAELIKLVMNLINEINEKNEDNEDNFIWKESIDFEIYDRKLHGNSHKMINIKPSDINAAS